MSDETPVLKPSKAGVWRESNRKTIVLPSGNVVVVRRLTGEFILVMQELFEKFLVATERGAKLRLSAAEQRRYIEAVVCEATVAPKVVPRDRAPAEDELQVDDFGTDLDALVKAIYDFNEEVLVTPFRTAQGELDAPSSSGSVPDAPEPAAEGPPA